MMPWLQSTFNFPLSGDVNQKIEPDWFFTAINSEVGDGEIEQEVFHTVASYGKQIGVLTDALLSVADELNLDQSKIEALVELKGLQTKVEVIKSAKKNNLKKNTKIMLDKLKHADQEAFDNLMDEYAAKA